MSLDERIEDLQCQGLKIVQNKKLYTFTSDSVILANYAKTKSKDVVVEIGAGSGVVSILLQAKNQSVRPYFLSLRSGR
jgi:tRNA1Val (adenine37-N6)-methyltransferase